MNKPQPASQEQKQKNPQVIAMQGRITGAFGTMHETYRKILLVELGHELSIPLSAAAPAPAKGWREKRTFQQCGAVVRSIIKGDPVVAKEAITALCVEYSLLEASPAGSYQPRPALLPGGQRWPHLQG